MIVKYVDKPMIREIVLFSGVSELKRNIIKNNSINVIVGNETQTQLQISVQAGTVSFRLNEQSPFSIENGLTFVTKTTWNYFLNKQTVDNYFKLTKKQNLKVLENHIISLIEKYIIEDLGLSSHINKDTFTIEIELPNELKMIKE